MIGRKQLSEDRTIYQTQYFEEPESSEVYREDEFIVPKTEEELELEARIAERKRKQKKRVARRKSLILISMILILSMLLTMCGREIIRLKAENLALKRQQQELTAERDRLRVELKNVSKKEYIKDQARKQLRLLDPGEIMFIFDDDE
ncbi:MAG: hypothetical protein E7220_04105 [Clostridiales bacterium]|nr:hypothetical protein [Clostridiales bacterium]